MNRVSNVVALRVAAAAIILLFWVSRLHAQTPTTPPPEHESTKSPDDKDAKETKDAKDAKEEEVSGLLIFFATFAPVAVKRGFGSVLTAGC